MSTDWRRQKVQDHKFDFIDVDDYLDHSPWRKFKYSLVFAIVIKGILIYCADLWTAVNLFVTNTWTSTLAVDSNGQISFEHINISFETYKWIFAACIILSFILLAWDMKKAYAIIQSRDISYAFTSMIAHRYYAVKSYAHFCLFQKIHNSKKTIDEVAFFCFFTFRGWKRLMFADGPRQVINGIILINVVEKNTPDGASIPNVAFWFYNFGILTKITIGLMIFTCTLWVISVLLMLVAVFLYIPLVIRIQGNLKEFCCHKIDRRIDEIVKRKAKQRAQEAAKNAKSGKGGDTPLQKPTLPNINLMEEGGRHSPMPGPPARLGPQSPYIGAGSPGVRKVMPVPNDPYRRQQPPRPYSPAPRPYTPNMEDDCDTRPLRQDNHQQHYHNRQHDYADDRSEISDNSAYSAHSNHLTAPYMAKPTFQGHGHRRQPSDTSTVLSGSNQGSVISGYGPRSGKPYPPRDGYRYPETVMMTDLSHRSPASGGMDHLQQQRYLAPSTGLGGGLGHGGSSVVGGSTINKYPPSRPHR